MTTASKPRIATPIKTERIVKAKPKTIKIGHGYYDLKFVKEIVNTLPDGQVTLTSYPGKPATNSYNRYSGNGIPPKVECDYPKGHFTLNAGELNYYDADNGKVKAARCLKYYQGEDQPTKTFSLLAVELPMKRGGTIC